MKDVKLSQNDIVITVLGILFVFIMIPLVLWGYSSFRTKRTVQRLGSEIEVLVRDNLPSAETLLDEFIKEYELSSEDASSPYGEYIGDSFSNSRKLTRDACDKFRLSVSGNTILRDEIRDRSYYYGECNLLYSIDDVYIISDYNSVYKYDTLSDAEYREDLEELLDSTSDLPINIHSHSSERSIHVVVLINENPMIVWDFELSLIDRY